MIWLTEIKAINPDTGELCKWSGPRIEADTMNEANDYCNRNGLGYCHVVGKFVMDIKQNIFDLIDLN